MAECTSHVALPSAEYKACKHCGVSEPEENLEDGVCECCLSGETKVTVRDLEQRKTINFAENSNKKDREPISFWYFWLGAGISVYLGIYLLSEYDTLWGVVFIITVAPILILYPFIRFIFGGKDSVGVLIATIVIEEIFKSKIKAKIRENENDRNR